MTANVVHCMYVHDEHLFVKWRAKTQRMSECEGIQKTTGAIVAMHAAYEPVTSTSVCGAL